MSTKNITNKHSFDWEKEIRMPRYGYKIPPHLSSATDMKRMGKPLGKVVAYGTKAYGGGLYPLYENGR